MGWLSPRAEGEEEESHLPRHAVRASILALPIDSLQAVPPDFISVFPWHFLCQGSNSVANNPWQLPASCAAGGGAAGDGGLKSTPSFLGPLLGLS